MSTEAPWFSVIIPAFHSAATMAWCLDGLREQTLRDFETIVVNSSREDETRRLVTTSFPEVVFEQSPTRLLPHAGRNRGAGRARGRYLAFTDPDCRARPDWLARLAAAHADGHPLVGGSMALDDSGWFARGVHLCKFFWALSGASPGPCWIAPTANLSCACEVWQATGPFEGDRFCGDALLSWRAAARGFPPWFEPRAVVRHRHETSPRGFWTERRARGREFAQARAAFERWSRRRAAAYLALLPVLPWIVLARAARAAWASGWGWDFPATLPVQFLGHVGWSLGEAGAHWSLALGRTDPDPLAGTHGVR